MSHTKIPKYLIDKKRERLSSYQLYLLKTRNNTASAGGRKEGEYNYLLSGHKTLNSVLEKNGFKSTTSLKNADFIYSELSNSNNKNGIKRIEFKYIQGLDNKYEFHELMKKYNLLDHVPKTYTNLSELTDDSLDDNKIYFLKHYRGGMGHHVFPVKSMKDIHDTLNSIQEPPSFSRYKIILSREGKVETTNINDYLVQEEVPNMYLHENKFKFTTRNYVLLCDSGNYFYNDGSLKIHNIEYDKDNLDKDIHVNVGGGHGKMKYEKFSDQTYYDQTLSEMISICSKLFTPYCKELSEKVSIKNQFIILGLDFIIDKDYKPYLIEINTTPAIEVSSNNGTPLIKEDMLDDFIKLYVLPKLKNKGPLENPEKNDWIKL